MEPEKSDISLSEKDFQHLRQIEQEDSCSESLKSRDLCKKTKEVESMCREDYSDNGKITFQTSSSGKSISPDTDSNPPSKNSLIEIHSNSSHPDAQIINIGQVDYFRQIQVQNRVPQSATCQKEAQHDTTLHTSKESLCVQCCILIGSVSLGSWYYSSSLVMDACALFKDKGVTKTFTEAFQKACLSNSLMFSTVLLLMLLFIVIIVCPIMFFNRRTKGRR